MISRPRLLARIKRALSRSRVVALVGPRQAGKTTLARQAVPHLASNYFDLENSRSLARLAQPMSALEGLRGVVTIDEVQRQAELFPTLRVLADRRPLPARFLVLGSASPALLRQSSESLAGRIEMLAIGGFELDDVGHKALRRHWLRGGFPRAFLARSDEESREWRRQFIQTFVERDVTQYGFGVPAVALLRFWTMLAHYHGQVWNAADPARSLDVSHTTVRRYLDVLTGMYMVRQLQPWYENLGKRQVKAPKIYLRDSGLLHQLLGIATDAELLSHPKAGASWEGYVLEQVIAIVDPDQSYFWATYQGAELDLLLIKSGRRYGVEMKYADGPTMTRSMHTALADLKLEHLFIIYPGSQSYRLNDSTTVVPISQLASLNDLMRPKPVRKRRG